MDEHGYGHTDLSDDDIAKEHVRHMIGGPAQNVGQEFFYQVDFPERPGALGDFLTSLGTRWNISAFHYRNQASDTGNVLIGFEATNRTTLEARLDEVGYAWTPIDDSPSMKLFIQ
jgi:threonine dehydratase